MAKLILLDEWCAWTTIDKNPLALSVRTVVIFRSCKEDGAMKAMIIIPMASYSNLIARCDVTRPEYLLLKNGVIENNLREVHILCSDDKAKTIIEFVNQAAPELLSAVRHIDIPL
jgi:hypothetical protein